MLPHETHRHRASPLPPRRSAAVAMVIVAGMFLMGGCPFPDPPGPESRPDPRLAGTWILADPEVPEYLGTVTIDPNGMPTELCAIRALPVNEDVYRGGELDHLRLDGVPRPSTLGPMIAAATSVWIDGERVAFGADAIASVGPLVFSRGSVVFNGAFESADLISGSYVAWYEINGEASVGVRPLVAYRLSDTPDCGLADDSAEPNDEPGQAISISIGQHDGLRCLNEDWFRVQVASGKTIRAGIDFDERFGELELTLLDAVGANELQAGGGWANFRVVDMEQPGEYLLRVRNPAGTPHPGYSLSLRSAGPYTLEDLIELLQEVGTAQTDFQ